MQCPIDGSELVMAERQGIEIDYCPKCRGVWLDRGELDKLIERSAPAAAPAAPERRPEPRHREEDRGSRPRDEDRYEHRSEHRDGYRPRKKKSLLGEIFDF